MLKKLLILIIFLMIGFGSSDNNFSLAEKNTDLFKEIIGAAQGTVTEYGVKASYETEKDGEAYCLELLDKLGITGGSVNIAKDEKLYSIDFKNNEIKGYIESMSYDNHNVVTVNLVQIDTENKLSELKYKVQKAIGNQEKEVKYFEYLKARISNRDKLQVNSEITETLRKYNAVNINTIQIDNGYSTVAYTKRYPTMKNNGKLMDLNYAVCSYSSGNYVVIGTPVIITTY